MSVNWKSHLVKEWISKKLRASARKRDACVIVRPGCTFCSMYLTYRAQTDGHAQTDIPSPGSQPPSPGSQPPSPGSQPPSPGSQPPSTSFAASFTRLTASLARFTASFTLFAASLTLFAASFTRFAASLTLFAASFTRFAASFTRFAASSTWFAAGPLVPYTSSDESNGCSDQLHVVFGARGSTPSKAVVSTPGFHVSPISHKPAIPHKSSLKLFPKLKVSCPTLTLPPQPPATTPTVRTSTLVS